MLTPREVAALVGLKPRAVRTGPLRDLLPWVRLGARGLRVRRDAVEALLNGDGKAVQS